MGRQGSGKSQKEELGASSSGRQSSNKAMDRDNEVFISMAKEMKEEGNHLFQRRDLEGAMLKYDKAIKLLPRNHIDVSNIRSNMATCYMQMGLSEYPKAIHECNLALEVTPKNGKALLKRAKCYEALEKQELCLRDVNAVLKMEPNNVTAGEVLDRVTKSLSQKGIDVSEVAQAFSADDAREKPKRKKSKKILSQKTLESEKKAEDKLVIEEKVTSRKEGSETTIKLVYEGDIRWANVQKSCSFSHLGTIIEERYPGLGEIGIKYKDKDGDLVSITTDEELRHAEKSSESEAAMRLYLVNQSPKTEEKEGRQSRMDGWMMEFAKLFKDQVGLESESCVSLHEIGSKVYSEALEEAVTSDEAQSLFDRAGKAFQEMAAIAMLNWGNMHMTKAKRKLHVEEAQSREAIMEHIRSAYDWAQKEYSLARRRYEESLRIKPDFYEGLLALGHQLFEQARLIWYYAVSTSADLEIWSPDGVIELYNCAEDNMERGMKLWEEIEETGSMEEGNVIKSQINLLWGTMLYERSVMEFKLGVPVWQECLEVAIEKFVLAGASASEIAVMIKSHVSNGGALEGLGFRIDEIVLAWSEMRQAKMKGMPSFRVEPLLRRRVSKLYQALEFS